MKTILISEIVSATGGRLLWGDDTAVVDHVIMDSREAGPGALFVPIIGERIDAHRFIPDVMMAGAVCTLTSDESVRSERGAGVYVKDTLHAMQDLAAWYRSQFTLPVIGITGSVGKTTTKEMIAAVMETKFRTLKTIRNLNSQIGVAWMMFHIEADTEMAVFEMGISMPGEMDRLVDIVRPETAIMTNIGVSHIGNLGTRENICHEKGKIITHFSLNGILYVCGNEDLKELSASCVPYDQCQGACRTIYYGTDRECTYYGDQIRTTENGQQFVFHYPEGQTEVRLSVMGTHNVNNAIVALALACQYGVPMEEAKKALEKYQPMAMRGVVKEAHGVHIIDDTYNASPDSINSNLHALFDYSPTGGKIAVLADVLELGERSWELHAGIGQYILEERKQGRELSLLVTVGEQSLAIHECVAAASPIPCLHCETNEEAAQIVRKKMSEGDWILVKGSRGMHMDQVVEQLTKE